MQWTDKVQGGFLLTVNDVLLVSHLVSEASAVLAAHLS